MESVNFIDASDVIKRHASDEEINKVILYVEKHFSDAISSNEQLSNCLNLVNFLNKYNIVIGEIESEIILDNSPRINRMFKILDNANLLVRVGFYREIYYLYDQYCLNNDVFLDIDADTGFLENKYGKKDLDLLKIYFNEISKYELLSVSEEKELFNRIAEGDEEARKKVIEHNLKLVISIAKHFRGRYLSFDDLIQFGNEGLLIAVRKFDVNKGYKFSTYATWWIKQSIRRGIADFSRTVRIPVHLHDCIIKVNYTINNFISLNGYVPSDEKLAEITGYSVERIKLARECMEFTVSLSTPVNEDEDVTLADVIVDENSSLDSFDRVNDKIIIENILLSTYLTEREKYIIKARNGFFGQIYTLEEIAVKSGLTRERVRQIEAKALGKLQKTAMRKNNMMFDVKEESVWERGLRL